MQASDALEKVYRRKRFISIKNSLDGEEYDNALDQISKLSVVFPEEVDFYCKKGEIFLALADLSTAIMFYRKAYAVCLDEKQRNDIGTRLAALIDGWGVLHMMRGEFKKADVLLAEASTLGNNVAAYWYHWCVLKRIVDTDEVALRLVNVALDLEPCSPLLLSTKAEILRSTGEHRESYRFACEAIKHDTFFAKALKLRSEYEHILNGLDARATAALLAHETDRCLSICEEAFAIVPNHLNFMCRKGMALARQLKFEEAKDVLRQAHRAAVERGEDRDEEMEIEMPVSGTVAPGPTPHRLRRRSDPGLDTGEAEGEDTHASRLEIDHLALPAGPQPLPPEIHSSRSFADSAVAVQTVHRTRSLLAHVYNECAISRFQSGRIHEAIQELNEAVRLDPNPLQFYINRGDCYLKLDDIRLALGNYHVVLRKDPENVFARARIAVCHHHFGTRFFNENLYAEAETEFSLAMKYNPSVARFYLDRARTALALKHVNIAFDDLRRSLELDNTSAEARTLFAQMCPQGRIPPELSAQLFGSKRRGSRGSSGSERRLPLHQTMAAAFRPTPSPF